MKADANDLNLVELIAGTYNESIYDATEQGWALEPIVREELVPSVPPKPENVVVNFTTLTQDTFVLNVNWTRPAIGGQYIIGFQLQWKKELGGVWSDIIVTTETSFSFTSVPPGTYFSRISAILLSGGSSQWVESPGAVAGSNTNLYFDYTRPQSFI